MENIRGSTVIRTIGGIKAKEKFVVLGSNETQIKQ